MTDDTTTDAPEETPERSESWGYLAWRMWCGGNRNKSAIFRTLKAKFGDAMPKWNDCIDAAIARESKIARAALDIDETDALTEYIGGLEEQFGEADRLMRTGDNDNAKLGGLKVKVDLLEKLAGAKGVTTKREAVGLHGVDGKPPVGLAWMEAVREGQSKREAAQDAEAEAECDVSAETATGE